ncbi:SemiSWEET family transporter [Dellaglioa sp. BT-FLS60]
MDDYERKVIVLGRLASILSVCMYVSYIPQIIDNLNGVAGNPLQPLVTSFNCILWCSYAFVKPHKDWPIIIANLPGIFLGLITFVTAIMA